MVQLAMVNAWTIYNSVYQTKMEITKSKLSIVKYLLEMEGSGSPGTKHQLEEVPGMKQKTKRRCTRCYNKLSREFGSNMANNRCKQVNTQCNKCKKFFCLDCFQNSHNRC